MKKSTLHISQLDSILENDALNPNLELFHDILDFISEQNWEKIQEEKAEYLLWVLEQILLSWWIVSESDAKVFLAFISSRDFRKAYITIIKNMSYIVDNSELNIEDAEAISRKNNPLFKLFDLQLQLESLIIKSRINDNLKKWNLVTSYDNGKFIRVNNEDNEIIDQNDNIFILYNPVTWYGLYRGTKQSWDETFTGYELISWTNEREDIQPSYHSEKYKFYTFFSEWKTFLYDLNKWKSRIACDSIHTFTEIGNDCYVHYKNNGKNYIFSSTFESEVFVREENEENFEVVDSIWNKYLVLENKQRLYSILNVHNGNILENLHSFKVVWDYLEFQQVNTKWLRDLSNMELLVQTTGFFSWVIESATHKNVYVRYGSEKNISLYDVKRQECALYGKSVLEIKSIPKWELAYFVDENGEGLYDIWNARMLLKWVRDIDINTSTYEKKGYTEISYKGKWFISGKRILTY